jgi:hypothetical protein
MVCDMVCAINLKKLSIDVDLNGLNITYIFPVSLSDLQNRLKDCRYYKFCQELFVSR